jgi:hypothetical protein
MVWQEKDHDRSFILTISPNPNLFGERRPADGVYGACVSGGRKHLIRRGKAYYNPIRSYKAMPAQKTPFFEKTGELTLSAIGVYSMHFEVKDYAQLYKKALPPKDPDCELIDRWSFAIGTKTFKLAENDFGPR